MDVDAQGRHTQDHRIQLTPKKTSLVGKDMAITKVISAVVFASAALLLRQTTPVAAFCACPAVYFLPSDYADMGAVVVRAKVLKR